MSSTQTERIADELMSVLGTGRQTGRHEGLAMAEAYAIAAEVRDRRRRRGERVVGRKIAFTNTTIWPLYGISAPSWNFMYDTTVQDLAAVAGGFDLAGLPEPRIEPEIVLGLARAPATDMSDAQLLGCVGWVAHGFEIVQSVYPGWTFSGPESAAAFGLHGALMVGPRQGIGADRAAWGRQLEAFAITLSRDGVAVAEGAGTNVLGGPIRALRFLVEEIARYQDSEPIAAGEMVTTGTLTDAQPVRPGETWSTALRGIPIDGIRLEFA